MENEEQLIKIYPEMQRRRLLELIHKEQSDIEQLKRLKEEYTTKTEVRIHENNINDIVKLLSEIIRKSRSRFGDLFGLELRRILQDSKGYNKYDQYCTGYFLIKEGVVTRFEKDTRSQEYFSKTKNMIKIAEDHYGEMEYFLKKKIR